jgi:hypothetical protein
MLEYIIKKGIKHNFITDPVGAICILVFIAHMVTTKTYFADNIVENTYYSKISEVELKLLNQFELAFLNLCQFKMFIDPHNFNFVKGRLLKLFANKEF